MIGPHVSKYSSLQASMLNASILSLYTIKYYWIFNPENVLKILAKILLFPLHLVYVVFSLIMWLLTLLGYVINLIFIIRLVYAVVYELFFSISEYVGYIVNFYDVEDYADYIGDINGEFTV